MGKFARSWALMKASASVLRSDKSLMMFPLLSGLCSLVVAASFLIPIAVTLGIVHHATANETRGFSLVAYLGMFVFYLVQYFIIIFFNTALAGTVLARLRGEPATMSTGFAVARSRWGSILGYAMIAATVGLFLRALQERLGLVGRMIAGLFGLAWTVASLLVVPVLASQQVGPMDAVSRSVALLKRTWGENLIGQGGIGVVFGVVTVITTFACGLLVVAAVTSQSMPAIVAAIALAVIGLITLALAHSALQGIYAAVLYRYAESGEVGGGFEPKLLEQAFRVRAD
jgi:hypothetical protein